MERAASARTHAKRRFSKDCDGFLTFGSHRHVIALCITMIPVSAVDDVVLNYQYVSQHCRLRGRALSVEPRPARVVAGTDGERMLRGAAQ
jgi:hypothetical protein